MRHVRTLFLCGFLVCVNFEYADSQASNGLLTQPNTDPGILCYAPSKPTTGVVATFLKADQNTSFRSYLEDNVLPMIRANWYRTTFKSSERAEGDATIEFTIVKDGSINHAMLTDGVGHAALGDLALTAVQKSGPFPPIPTDAGPALEVSATLSYAPPAKDPAADWPRPPRYSHLCSSDETAKGSVDCLIAPKPTYNPEPEFTEAARRQMAHGIVMVRTLVAADGTVSHACAEQPVGYGLDQKAVEAIRTWKFDPAVMNGKRSETQLEIEVDFRLQSKADGPASAPIAGPVDSDNSTPQVTAKIVAEPSPCTTQGYGCVTPPRLILSPMPEDSSANSTPTKYSGTATLQLTVTTEGIPTDIKVLKSLGPGLDEKAVTAVQKWKFVPAQKNGQPVATQIVVEVEFHLK